MADETPVVSWGDPFFVKQAMTPTNLVPTTEPMIPCLVLTLPNLTLVNVAVRPTPNPRVLAGPYLAGVPLAEWPMPIHCHPPQLGTARLQTSVHMAEQAGEINGPLPIALGDETEVLGTKGSRGAAVADVTRTGTALRAAPLMPFAKLPFAYDGRITATLLARVLTAVDLAPPLGGQDSGGKGVVQITQWQASSIPRDGEPFVAAADNAPPWIEKGCQAPFQVEQLGLHFIPGAGGTNVPSSTRPGLRRGSSSLAFCTFACARSVHAGC